MIEIPLNATVECVDGHAGKCTHVVFDSYQRVVTHIVVKEDKSFAALDWLVPIAHIAGSTHDLIRLGCTTSELSKMSPFTTSHISGSSGYDASGGYDDYSVYALDYTSMSSPYAIPTTASNYMPDLDEAIPAGERAVMYGAKVEATDGTVGTVGELLIDSDTGAITHFTLQAGHFWGKNEVMLPLSAVDRSEED